MITNKIPTTYVGGPLDGQTATRSSGRWSIYRDDSGQPIPTPKGDREVQGKRRRFYAHQNTADGGHYVHLTVLDDWHKQRRRP